MSSTPGSSRRRLEGGRFGGIASLNTGTPLSLTSGIDNSLTGIGEDTPDVVGNWNLGKQSRANEIAHWFNPAAFVQNAVGTFGQLRPNSLTNPGYVNFDINLQKNFIFTERYRPEFRSSFYNAFNHANLGWARNHSHLFQFWCHHLRDQPACHRIWLAATLLMRGNML